MVFDSLWPLGLLKCSVWWSSDSAETCHRRIQDMESEFKKQEASKRSEDADEASSYWSWLLVGIVAASYKCIKLLCICLPYMRIFRSWKLIISPVSNTEKSKLFNESAQIVIVLNVTWFLFICIRRIKSRSVTAMFCLSFKVYLDRICTCARANSNVLRCWDIPMLRII